MDLKKKSGSLMHSLVKSRVCIKMIIISECTCRE